MAKKRTLADMKKRGEAMYLRLAHNDRATRWEMIVSHALSLMTTGKPAFNANAVLRAEAAEVAAEKKAEAAEAEPFKIVAPEEVSFKAVSEPTPYTQAPTGTYDHDYWYNMYRPRPLGDPNMDHPGD
jgi:hypothetical protein